MILTTHVELPKTEKTYRTHNRACRYGFCKNASPVTMLNGETRWVARPFWRHDGGTYKYTLKD
jgi:hypothetical protein